MGILLQYAQSHILSTQGGLYIYCMQILPVIGAIDIEEFWSVGHVGYLANCSNQFQ